MDLNKTLEIVIKVAHKAGAYLREEQSKLVESAIEKKNTRNYVTYIDKEAEKLIVSELSEAFPETGFLTEEETIVNEVKEWTWIIDPLDGTTNYVNGDTSYTVSIALQHNNKTVLGVVYDPLLEELYCATTDSKATLNNKLISVSNHSTITDAFIGFGVPYTLDTESEAILKRASLQYSKASFRIKGSAAVEICYVAAGRYDVFFHSGLSPWDVAAASFILQQAGGKNKDFKNGDNYIFGRELIASNGHMHNEIMKHIINDK